VTTNQYHWLQRELMQNNMESMIHTQVIKQMEMNNIMAFSYTINLYYEKSIISLRSIDFGAMISLAKIHYTGLALLRNHRLILFSFAGREYSP